MSREKKKVLYSGERSYVDNLTLAYNRKFFNDQLRPILIKAMAENVAFTYLLINVDDFAQYNEVNGYERGDQVLQQISYLFKRNLRSEDYLIRYGGDEFLVIVPNTPKNEAFAVAERLRKIIENHQFTGEKVLLQGKITVSIGLASFPEDGDSIDFLVKRADTALFHAKKRMKNRVEVFCF